MEYATDLMNATVMSTAIYPDYYTSYTSVFDDNEDEQSLHPSQYMQVTFYFLVFAFSLCVNVLVLIIINRFERLTTVNNLLLLNLVLSSLLFISTLTFVALYVLLLHWPFGGVLCKLMGSLHFLGFNSSVLFLALMTFDRHLAVVYSIRAVQLRTRSYAVVSCVAVWMITALASIKPMIALKVWTNPMNGQNFCIDQGAPLLRAVGFYTQLLLFFLFPLLLTVYCYIRITCTLLSSQTGIKFKTTCIIFVIVLLFLTCWTPLNIAMVMYELASTDDECTYWVKVLGVTETIAHIYYCISIIFYTFVGKKFQNYFLVLLVKCFPGQVPNEL